MFVQFVVPHAVRNDPLTYKWIVDLAITRLGRDAGLLSPAIYWANDTNGIFGSVPKAELPENLLSGLAQAFVGPNLLWAHTIREPIPSLQCAVAERLASFPNVEALILWTNCCSAKYAARSASVPTIHNELGPLREPHFRQTAYFDFEGVNGCTDADRRWALFLNGDRSVPTLHREELLRMLSTRHPPSLTRTHEVGVALQVPDDSNLIAFNHGFTNFEAVTTAQKWLDSRVLVRPHPGQPERFEHRDVEWDCSDSGPSFLERISELVTINSSLGFEAMLRGKPTYVLGDAPFRAGSWDITTRSPRLQEPEMTMWLNWFVFAYLIPFERLFDASYYRWRLSEPSENEIYLSNYDYWRKLGAKGIGAQRSVFAVHPHWTGSIALSEDGTLTHEQHGSRGRYIMTETALVVQWDHFPSDVFLVGEGGYVHSSILLNRLSKVDQDGSL